MANQNSCSSPTSLSKPNLLSRSVFSTGSVHFDMPGLWPKTHAGFGGGASATEGQNQQEHLQQSACATVSKFVHWTFGENLSLERLSGASTEWMISSPSILGYGRNLRPTCKSSAPADCRLCQHSSRQACLPTSQRLQFFRNSAHCNFEEVAALTRRLS